MNETGSILLDTSVVVDYLRQQSTVHDKIDRAQNLYLPLVVLGELLYGAFRVQNRAKAAGEVRDFCQGCVLLLPTETTAELYAEIKAQLASAGTPIPQNDVWIAAVAREHQLPVATRDRHFALVRGLTVLDW